MKNFLIIVLLLILLIIIILLINKNKTIESYENESSNYLYPTTTLGDICEKENLEPSFMPKACYVDGKLNSYANCKCEDKDGNCRICYDELKRDNNNATVIFDSSKKES